MARYEVDDGPIRLPTTPSLPIGGTSTVKVGTRLPTFPDGINMGNVHKRRPYIRGVEGHGLPSVHIPQSPLFPMTHYPTIPGPLPAGIRRGPTPFISPDMDRAALHSRPNVWKDK